MATLGQHLAIVSSFCEESEQSTMTMAGSGHNSLLFLWGVNTVQWQWPTWATIVSFSCEESTQYNDNGHLRAASSKSPFSVRRVNTVQWQWPTRATLQQVSFAVRRVKHRTDSRETTSDAACSMWNWHQDAHSGHVTYTSQCTVAMHIVKKNLYTKMDRYPTKYL